MNLSRLRVSIQLAIGFGLLLSLMLVICGYSVLRLHVSSEQVRQLSDHQWQSTQAGAALRSAIELNGVRVSASARLGGHEYALQMMNDTEKSQKDIDALQARLDASIQSDELRTIYTRLLERRKTLQDIVSKVKKLQADSDFLAVEEVIQGDYESARRAYLDDALALQTLSTRQTEEATTKLASDSSTAAWVAAIMCAAALLFSIGFGWWQSRSLGGPLRDAARRAQAIAQGDLTSDVEVNSGGEIGDLQHALVEMQIGLRALVGEVRGVTDSVETGSSEIASGNQDLSQRTEQTAANLQRTVITMSSLAEAVRHTADSASSASLLAAQSSGVAAQGGEIVSQVVTSMQNIQDASAKIGNIIGVIDGIAFQTNILALNAAVEAARAGEHGRGFAVVAAEVRNLAQRSAASAKEIKNLIGASAEHVNTGSELVQRAGTTMADVVQSVKRVSQLVVEISQNLQQQLSTLGSVEQDIHQVDGMTQQNSALVEQSAAAASSLQQNAQVLSSRVGRFKLSV